MSLQEVLVSALNVRPCQFSSFYHHARLILCSSLAQILLLSVVAVSQCYWRLSVIGVSQSLASLSYWRLSVIGVSHLLTSVVLLPYGARSQGKSQDRSLPLRRRQGAGQPQPPSARYFADVSLPAHIEGQRSP